MITFSTILARSVSSYDEINKRLTKTYPEQFQSLLRNCEDIRRKLDRWNDHPSQGHCFDQWDDKRVQLEQLFIRQTNKLQTMAALVSSGKYYPVTRSISRVPPDKSKRASKPRQVDIGVDRNGSLPRAYADLGGDASSYLRTDK
jgi:hypothetical protein